MESDISCEACGYHDRYDAVQHAVEELKGMLKSKGLLYESWFGMHVSLQSADQFEASTSPKQPTGIWPSPAPRVGQFEPCLAGVGILNQKCQVFPAKQTSL